MEWAFVREWVIGASYMELWLVTVAIVVGIVGWTLWDVLT